MITLDNFMYFMYILFKFRKIADGTAKKGEQVVRLSFLV
jgi:hypothetical protein